MGSCLTCAAAANASSSDPPKTLTTAAELVETAPGEREFMASSRVSESKRANNDYFLRAAELGDGRGSAQTLSRAYRRGDGKGPTVWLVSAAHFGTPAYYAQLQKRLDEQTYVWYEGVGCKSDDAHKGYVAITQELAKMSELSDQLSVINYGKPPKWKHVDVKMNDGTAAVLGKIDAAMPQLVQLLKPFPPDAVRQLFLAMCLIGVQVMTDQTAKEPDRRMKMVDTVLCKRDEHVLAHLEKHLKDVSQDQSVALFYGAAHMPALHQRLQAMSFTAVQDTWDTAFECSTQFGQLETLLASLSSSFGGSLDGIL